MSTRREEVQQKQALVAEYLRLNQLEAVVLSRRCNFAWFTAGGLNHVPMASEVGASSLIITPRRAVCLSNNIEGPRLRDEELTDTGITLLTTAWHDAYQNDLYWQESVPKGRVACDVPVYGVPAAAMLLGPDFDRLRWTLTEAEVERYRGLGRDVADCLETAARSAAPGMTEHQLAGRLANHLLERGIRPSVILVAADERVRLYRHPLPTYRKFEDYGMVVCGGERHGLIVSATRLVSFKPISDDLRWRHEAVCRVDSAMIAQTQPGETLGSIFRVAQKAYRDVSFSEEWQLHHQGGATGYLGRETKAAPDHREKVLLHQAFAWNPSIAGTKSEDTILVGVNGNEILSDTGMWPRTEYEAAGRTWPRCDILEL